MKYEKFQEEDFIADDDFLQWVWYPDQQNELFWSRFLEEYPEKQNTVQRARERVLSLSEEEDVPGEVFSEIRDNIRKYTHAEPERKRRRLFGTAFIKYAAAAVILLGVAGGLLFFDGREQEKAPVQLVAGSGKAMLTLDNGEVIELSEETEYQSGGVQVKNRQLLYDRREAPSEALSYHYLTIPRGGKFTVALPDGTKVWLNSDSKLKYPVHFRSGQPREIELLYGEAYFEVSHSTEHDGDSFRVITGNQDVEVLGTQFNIRAYPEESEVYTTLSEGSIAVSNGEEHAVIMPGQQVITGKPGIPMRIKDTDTGYAAAWKNGLFVFEKETLGRMMDELSRWYDAEVVFEHPEKAAYRFSGELKRDEDIRLLLDNLEQTGEVGFEINGKTITIK
ncbi:FecR domain-containing protein [Sinomicrobium soli]|uniref:FecR domain-containing protein n=1 Tax=Sinomicrobium sp. N-1-3-6 TaxID=2219864 RepID=UPI000DCCAD1D|nr:FecR domain-containing protein [Sinomicrobium sp. N-1-3-6]RAV28481.1 anti-sigma factor [Sinomicrobium sp. N-1-3-6]